MGNKNDDDDQDGSGGATVTSIVSTTDPDCGMFAKGEHERQFAYEAHTACDQHGWILGVEVTAGNVSDSVAWDAVYGQVTDRFPEAKFIVMDAGYKTPWIAHKTLEDSRIPILPYTRYKGKKDKDQQRWETYLSQHAEALQRLLLPASLRRQRERPAYPYHTYLAGIP